DNDNHVNWLQWFIPTQDSEMDDVKFLLSPDCSSCDETVGYNLLYSKQSTYYMSGTIFGCFWATKGQHNCDVDYDTYSCYSCVGNFIVTGGDGRIELNADTINSYVEKYSTTYVKGLFSVTGICPVLIN